MMVDTLDWWPAPAKLNLMLRILGQREDGYHALQTVFQFVDYGDALAFEIEGQQIVRAGSGDAIFEDDLTLRAAKLLQKATGCQQGVKIHLKKVLPVGGGVGGGSSDAATTMVALNQLWSLGLSVSALAELGLILGADVPVFIEGRAAWAEGVGEALTPIELKEPWYLVVTPDVFVSTATVFNRPELPRNSQPISQSAYFAGSHQNDCTDTVMALYPEIKAVHQWLQSQGEARLTGTGASVFLALNSQENATDIARKMPKQWPFFIAKGKNVSPLLEKIN